MVRDIDIWLRSYLAQALRPRPLPEELTLCVVVANHFEPYWAQADHQTAMRRLNVWLEGWPRVAEQVADSRGRAMRHDFFYPIDQYDPPMLDGLAGLVERGLAGVEVHWHHHGETSAQAEEILGGYASMIRERHGLLRPGPDGRPTYGFIHGDWALDNSHPDGKYCGLNDELSILARTGCYADFTLPSAPGPTQTSTINGIYYAQDDPQRPKSHDRGRPATVGQAPPAGDLLLIQGVLALDWRRRKLGLLPKIENSDLAWHLPPSPRRLGLWTRFAPSVQGAPQVRFLKLHCHGAPEANHEALLGAPFVRTFRRLVQDFGQGPHRRVLFLTCWEMAQAVHCLERGESLPW